MSEHSMSYAMGVGFGIFIAVAILILFKKLSLMKKPEYDERQLYEQGRANTIAYRFSLAGMGLILFLYGFKDDIPNEVIPLAILLVVVLSVMVFATYCIFHDAYFTTEEMKPNKKLTLLWILIIVLNLVTLVLNLQDGGFYHDGRANVAAISSLVIIMLIGTIFLATFIHSYSAGRNDSDDDDIIDEFAEGKKFGGKR